MSVNDDIKSGSKTPQQVAAERKPLTIDVTLRDEREFHGRGRSNRNSASNLPNIGNRTASIREDTLRTPLAFADFSCRLTSTTSQTGKPRGSSSSMETESSVTPQKIQKQRDSSGPDHDIPWP